MNETTVYIAIAVLLIGALAGFLLGRLTKALAGAEAVTQARQDAAAARDDASRARDEAARSRVDAARQETAMAELESVAARAQQQAAEAQAARSEVAAKLASALAERDAARGELQALKQDRDSLIAQFKLLSEESLQQQGERAEKTAEQRLAATQQLVTPLSENLKTLNERLTELEKERTRLAAELGEQVKAVQQSNERVSKETLSLANALRTPQVRGSWGEQSLRRIVEIAGLTQRCHFDDQQSYDNVDGERYRPDMRINLADGKVVFVDSKVPLAAVLEAYNTEDEAEQAAHLSRFARHVRTHIDDLAGKNYWELELGSPEFVVLFLGSDEFYRLALEHLPDLHEYAAKRNVMLACPGTLIPMLHIVAHGWKQVALAESAAKVATLGRDLYKRITTMGEHFDRLGKSLTTSVNHFNKAVGTLESRVMVSARRFNELGVTEAELVAPKRVEPLPRTVDVPEMLDYQEQRELIDDSQEPAAETEQDLGEVELASEAESAEVE